ncbi:hypothetical protein Tco_1088844, partial [Tanacetum coccineum]
MNIEQLRNDANETMVRGGEWATKELGGEWAKKELLDVDGTTLKRTPTESDLDARSQAGVTGGDMKRKGKLEPYAYWPLDRKM